MYVTCHRQRPLSTIFFLLILHRRRSMQPWKENFKQSPLWDRVGFHLNGVLVAWITSLDSASTDLHSGIDSYQVGMDQGCKHL